MTARSDRVPYDGSVSSNGNLQVHTNGTRALATFDTAPAPSKRATVGTQDNNFYFTGVAGVKITAIWEESIPTIDIFKIHTLGIDTAAFAYGFAYGSAGNETFRESDVWQYAICDRRIDTLLFYGRAVVENAVYGLDQESDGVTPSCSFFA